jgi:hypothetical protein
MTHEIIRDGVLVDVWDELGPAEALPVTHFNVARHPVRARRKTITAVIQRGHCFRTTGSTGAPGEQGFNSTVAVLVAEQAQGFIQDVGHQAKIINADLGTYPAGDFFVAQHYDGSVNPAASGASVGYDTDAGQALAHRWKQAYRDLGWTRGFRADNYTAALRSYYGYSRARAAGIKTRCVLEAGFGSNPGDRAWLDSDEGRTACAAAICIACTGINPLDQPAVEEDDVAPRDVLKFVQAANHPDPAKRPVFLANILELSREGIETHAARKGIAGAWGLDENVIAVHPDVIDQFRVKA